MGGASADRVGHVVHAPADDAAGRTAVAAGGVRGLDRGAVCSRETETPAASLAQALELDMHDWWTPTAAGYFEHVSKAKALEAVLAFAPGHVARLSKLKNADIASEAERLAAGTGWLPAMPCTTAAEVESATGGISHEATGNTACALHEDR